MISNGCLAIVYFVEIILCVKMTSKANPSEIVRKSAEACAELIPSKSGERYSHFCKWKSENNVKKITQEIMLAGLFFRFGLNGCIILFVNYRF
jgi:hypothetical protein